MNSLIILINLCVVILAQKAFLFSSSVGYYNYRQNANVLKIYQILKDQGFQDKDLILAFPQNVGCCQKNPKQGIVTFYDNEQGNLNKNLQVDMKYSTINTQTLVNSLSMKYPEDTLNIHRLALNDQPYLVYVTGHGGDFYFKVRQRQALVNQHFQHAFQDLVQRVPQIDILLLSDSCSAITPFEYIELDQFIAIGSSSFNEKSLSYGYDSELNMPKSDEFTYYLSQFVKEKDFNLRTIKELWKYMDMTKLKVHSKLVSKSKRKANQLLKKFMFRELQIKQQTLKYELPAFYLPSI